MPSSAPCLDSNIPLILSIYHLAPPLPLPKPSPLPSLKQATPPAMFESGYQAIIDKINKIQSHGLSHKLSIPQMAIIGDQSSGKSSVLEAISKLSFL